MTRSQALAIIEAWYLAGERDIVVTREVFWFYVNGLNFANRFDTRRRTVELHPRLAYKTATVRYER